MQALQTRNTEQQYRGGCPPHKLACKIQERFLVVVVRLGTDLVVLQVLFPMECDLQSATGKQARHTFSSGNDPARLRHSSPCSLFINFLYLLRLHLSVFHIHFVATENDWDVLTHSASKGNDTAFMRIQYRYSKKQHDTNAFNEPLKI